ncbi:D-2-hydroxyacid dehydrogenase [Fictibacillus terranigra]|uniref:D-2-hydroxyacid dehydrogenase n=1 Tax=Fictibacillus terranigra TaxID=3058424 RepID=A0ABT8E915_9BACL|nr:D-2-hydroxyacid dehydrogenase [Fictibacillus sp. CENA-BCM004]MDN4074375.1 D-2-hydroxyacid dehydrogenase [Fictibacillus sp. CENA-BCM004]
MRKIKINNLLVVSPMYNKLKTIIDKEELHKNFRFLPEEEMTQEDLVWADAYASFNLKSDYDYSSLKWVHSLGAGVDCFLYKKQWNEDVLLTRTICSFGQRIAEYCLSYILKDLQLHDPFQKLKNQKKWHPLTPGLLNTQKIMVYGTGEIGQTAAKIFSGLGMEVYGVSLTGKNKEYFEEVLTVASHFSRLQEMNYVINTLPLTDQTAHFFDGRIFHHLTDAGFINVGRGASVDDHALIQALNQGQVSFAVLDVFNHEPLPEDHPFWHHPDVHITPHISAVTTPEEGAACYVETLKRIEGNRVLQNKVDFKRGY